MNDDDKQPSYERLDESRAEKNSRSFFDWLRGREETDEEKLRKKLDEELKEAARKRATEFEEERREEEAREVAETKKLKKRWRAKLVEKSKALLEEAAEAGEEPVNGYEIAKLMVAERIVKYHEMLTDESLDLRRSEIKALKIRIDFMGLLSEKLDRPELEVPEEVENLYQTIAASVEETTGETPPKPADDTVETPPVSPEDASYTAFAASIVLAIRKALRPAPETTGGGGDDGSGAEAGHKASSSLSTPSASESAPSSAERRTPLTEKLLSAVKRSAQSTETIRDEISHTETARKLADIVEKAAIIERQTAKSAEDVIPALAIAGLAHHEASKDREPTHTEAQKRKENEFYVPPDRKIKHMTDLELLNLAKLVEISPGRALSDAYKRGELDREGLVKVLESYKKGYDYHAEFLLRRGNWQKQQQQSQEFLHASQPAVPHDAQSQADNHEKKFETVPDDPTLPAGNMARKTRKKSARETLRRAQGAIRNIGQSLPAAAQLTKREAGRFARETKERVKRQGHVTLLIASVLLIAIVFLIVIELVGHL